MSLSTGVKLTSNKIMQKPTFESSENGSILLTTVIILLLLSLIGISGMNTASTDLQITRNHKIYKENFYLGDGAVMELLQTFDNATGEMSGGSFSSISADDTTVDDQALQETTWTASSIDSTFSSGNAHYLWAPRGVTGSLDVTKPRIHEYFLYGKGSEQDGEVTIKVGYSKPF